MTEKNTLKSFVLFVFVFSVMALSQAAFAAYVASPTVPGYNSGAGTFSSPAGGFTMAPANDAYIKPSIVNVGGKPITVPAKLKMAANAGQFAKNALKLNPLAIAGTLAAPWLVDQGLQWMAETGEWMKSSPFQSTYPGTDGGTCYCYPSSETLPACMVVTGGSASVGYGSYIGCGMCDPYLKSSKVNATGCAEQTPAQDSDWDALPSPLAPLAPELPYAPYMPEGVPVDAPDYDFAPMSVPVGEPYTKPDGSTAQPMAKVSPNGDKVTIDTYDQPLTDPQGNPAPDTTPQDTQEPQPSECEKHPNTLGCLDPGTDTFPLLQKETHTMVFTPEASPISGGCPASIGMPGGHVLSFASACDAMTQIRPIVLALAGVLTAFMVIGVMRN